VIHEKLIGLMGYILLLRENLVVRALHEELIKSDRNSNEDIVLLLFDGDKLDFCVIFSDFIVSK
jgi:hypothetical protein